MKNFKKIGILSFLVVGLILVAGCGRVNVGQKATNSNAEQNRQRNGNTTSTENFNMGVKAAASDLVVGKKITAMGSANDDGSINATRIVLGEPENFMARNGAPTGTPPNMSTSSSDNAMPTNNGTNVPPSGERPNFQNGQPGGAGGRMSGKSVSRVSGEIISKDDTSLVVKVADGGSKIIFYSSKTEVFIFQTPTSTPATPEMGQPNSLTTSSVVQ